MRRVLPVFLMLLLLCLPAFAETEGDFVYRAEGGRAVLTGWLGETPSLTLPEKLGGLPLTEIGVRAFAGAALDSVTFPACLETIGEEAFCESTVWELRFSRGLVTLGAGAFARCPNLLGAALPDSLVRLGNGAFAGCPQLR